MVCFLLQNQNNKSGVISLNTGLILDIYCMWYLHPMPLWIFLDIFLLQRLHICKMFRGVSPSNCTKITKICPFLFILHACPTFFQLQPTYLNLCLSIHPSIPPSLCSTFFWPNYSSISLLILFGRVVTTPLGEFFKIIFFDQHHLLLPCPKNWSRAQKWTKMGAL